MSTTDPNEKSNLTANSNIKLLKEEDQSLKNKEISMRSILCKINNDMATPLKNTFNFSV
jgi:hypothetical protein